MVRIWWKRRRRRRGPQTSSCEWHGHELHEYLRRKRKRGHVLQAFYGKYRGDGVKSPSFPLVKTSSWTWRVKTTWPWTQWTSPAKPWPWIASFLPANIVKITWNGHPTVNVEITWNRHHFLRRRQRRGPAKNMALNPVVIAGEKCLELQAFCR